MSSIGSPIDTSLLQTAQAQQTASKARDQERASRDRPSRYRDLVDLRVAGLETAEAVRRIPRNDSEQAESEHHARRNAGPGAPPPTDAEEEPPRIDVQA